MIVQNLALCRYIYIWAMLFLFNVVPFSPLCLLGIIIVMEFWNQASLQKTYVTPGKAVGMLLADITFFVLIFVKDKRPYIVQNILFLVFYMLLLRAYQTDIVTLHTQLLKQDDIIHRNEPYLEYMRRIWDLAI